MENTNLSTAEKQFQSEEWSKPEMRVINVKASTLSTSHAGGGDCGDFSGPITGEC
jgi:hypothetical protein